MSTYQDFVYNSTPANADLLRTFGAIRGLVASKIIYAANLRDGVCRFGFRRIADELGLSLGAISSNINELENDGYVLMVQPAHGTDPAHYKPTDKLLFLVNSVQEVNAMRSGGERNNGYSVQEVNASVQEVNKEEDKQDLKEGEEESRPIEDIEIPKTNFELMQDAIRTACRITTTRKNQSTLLSVTRDFLYSGKTPDQIIDFGVWFNGRYWKGKYPSVSQIQEHWPKFEDYINNGSNKSTNGKPPISRDQIMVMVKNGLWSQSDVEKYEKKYGIMIGAN